MFLNSGKYYYIRKSLLLPRMAKNIRLLISQKHSFISFYGGGEEESERNKKDTDQPKKASWTQ